MLDATTKKRIDDCRDILVGKVPDPKSQIEQITIALIYKFMDDMDREAVEMGGERSFFSAEYEKYAWSNLFRSDLGGPERVKLYDEAVEKMEENPYIPALFRNIFKNAYLPYRDPETLRNFLKYINDFNYSHSEQLGDAFEYLLSILGSQGDAGQFRTPRHIIDFMAAVIDPQKGETILDPACGTAGFLISAYKHILKKNSSNYDPDTDKQLFELQGLSAEELIVNGKQYKGDRLTPDERTQITHNVRGYDISPDMVRLSLVNMYLHNFSDPHIYEYDTLTSDDRWNEFYDIILANPPFMSPKGGIRPHKRFSVQSKRSEVLFVDYMAEHLNASGRAAIIVPEGIIFQTGNAYKNLRKMLVDENFLVGIISLPAGVFNPYSGVKTSILWLDKALARKTDNILFVKIENDGFDLGAQRRPVKENDLPEAFRKITAYKNALHLGEPVDFDDELLVSIVSKKEIAENGDYNLSGERYKTNIIINSDFPIVSLSEVAEVIAGQSPKGEYYNEEGIGLPFYQGKTEFGKRYIGNPKKWTTQITKEAFKGDILMSVRAPVGPVNYATQHCCIGRGLAAIRVNDKMLNSFLFSLLKAQEKNIKGSGGAVFDNINKKQIEVLQIPLPPLSVQEEIVAEIEGYQKIIDGARQVVDNYKPQIDIDPDWEMVELGEVCEVNPKKAELKDLPENIEVSFVPMADLNENQVDFIPKQTRKLKEVIKGYTYFKENDVLLAKVTPCFENGKAGIAKNLINGVGFGSSEYYVFRPNEKILSMWIYLNITDDNFRLTGKLKMTGTGGLQRVPKDFVITSKIPLPPIETQRQIVVRIEREQQLVDAARELIGVFEEKIRERIKRIWGEKK